VDHKDQYDHEDDKDLHDHVHQAVKATDVNRIVILQDLDYGIDDSHADEPAIEQNEENAAVGEGALHFFRGQVPWQSQRAIVY